MLEVCMIDKGLKVCDFNHFILYAKHQYKRSDDIVADVQKIMSERCGHSVSVSDTWNLCVIAMFKYLPQRDIEDIVHNIFNQNEHDDNVKARPERYLFFTGESNIRRGIGMILSKLSVLSVRAIDNQELVLNIGLPDPKILPLNKVEGF
jgi:hypothetical protein